MCFFMLNTTKIILDDIALYFWVEFCLFRMLHTFYISHSVTLKITQPKKVSFVLLSQNSELGKYYAINHLNFINLLL